MCYGMGRVESEVKSCRGGNACLQPQVATSDWQILSTIASTRQQARGREPGQTEEFSRLSLGSSGRWVTAGVVEFASLIKSATYLKKNKLYHHLPYNNNFFKMFPVRPSWFQAP